MHSPIHLSFTMAAALLSLGTLIIYMPGCHSDSAKCSWFLRPSIFPNVPPTLRFKYTRLLARTSPALTYKDVLLQPKSNRLTDIDPICVHCSLFKRSLPAWSTGNQVAPFGWRDLRRFLAPALLDNGFQVMRKPHNLDTDKHTLWYGISSQRLIRRGFLTATYQKYNRLPHVAKIDNKAHLERMARRLYRLFPHFERLRTWILPGEKKRFLAEWRARQDSKAKHNETQLWVLKPVTGSTSKGVRVVTQLEQVQDQLKPNSNAKPFHHQYVIQEYVPDPFLIRGRKAELRMYVVVTSTTPLRAYLSTPAAAVAKNGLRPFTMDPGSLSNKCVHTIPRHGCGNTGTHTRIERLNERDLDKAQLEAVYSRIKEILVGLLLLSQKQAWAATKHVLLNRYSGYHPMTFDFFLDKSKQDGNVTVYFNEMNNMRAIHSEVEAGHVPFTIMNLAGYHLPPLSAAQAKLLQKCQPALNSSASVFDERLYKAELSEKERSKQERVLATLLATLRNSNSNTSDTNFDFETEIDKIMDDIIRLNELTPDDVRYLITLFNEEARAEPYFWQVLPLRSPSGERARPRGWQDVYSRMKYYSKVLLSDWKASASASSVDGATSALYYYALYEGYTRKFGKDLKVLNEFAEASYHLQ